MDQERHPNIPQKCFCSCCSAASLLRCCSRMASGEEIAGYCVFGFVKSSETERVAVRDGNYGRRLVNSGSIRETVGKLAAKATIELGSNTDCNPAFDFSVLVKGRR